MKLMTPVSPGELLDKLTILDIKSERIEDADKVANVRHEQTLLEAVWEDTQLDSPEIQALRAELKRINEALWEIEDDIRLCENAGDFGERFIELARAVYVTNDQRAAVKKKINLALGSAIVEEKSYQDYGQMDRGEQQ
ncbi:MAG: DUF6165 family protein [Pseudomonadota bacterium]